MQPRIIRILLCLVFVVTASAQANDWRVEGADRVVAISDVHGAYDAMVSTLKNVGLLNDELEWAGGTARLVIVGDILDRGPRSRDAMDLLMRLENEAQTTGGYVHVLIGNHESMNMIGDLRYVSKEEYAAFAADETAEQRQRWLRAYVRRHPVPRDEDAIRKKFENEFPAGYFALRAAFSSTGKYGKWLLGKPIIAVIDGTAFVHGGLSPVVIEHGLDGVNTTLQSELAAYVRAIDTLMEAEVLLPTDSQYDYISIVDRFAPSLNEKPEVIAAVKTPTREVLQRFDGRLVEVDTGMLNFYYNGSGNALVLSGDSIAVYNQSGAEPYAPVAHPRDVGIRPHNMPTEELADLLRNGEVVASTKDALGRTVVDISDGDYVVKALFARRGGRGFYPDAAAYRLDRLLELDMVPVSVRREVDGRDGTVQFFPAKIMDEAARAANGRGRSASCPLQDQFRAMYVFDALIYNEGRTLNRMVYDTRDWGLMLFEHERAFSTKKGRPRYLQEAPVEITPGWRTALQALNDGVLETALGDVLDKKRLRALATRRDELLLQSAAASR